MQIFLASSVFHWCSSTSKQWSGQLSSFRC